MMTGELKARCIQVLQKFIGEFQQVCKHEVYLNFIIYIIHKNLIIQEKIRNN
jgi:hypothetical protein